MKRLESLGVGLEKISFLENGYWIIKSKFSLGATAEYLLGLYLIQEAAAQIPATLFTELENKTVLDWAIKTLNLEVEEINCFGKKALTNVFGRQLDRSIVNCRRIWPEQTQGFFVCKLKKHT